MPLANVLNSLIKLLQSKAGINWDSLTPQCRVQEQRNFTCFCSIACADQFKYSTTIKFV